MPGIEREPQARLLMSLLGVDAHASLWEGHAHSVVGPVGFTGGQPDLVRTSDAHVGGSAGGAPHRPEVNPLWGAGQGEDRSQVRRSTRDRSASLPVRRSTGR